MPPRWLQQSALVLFAALLCLPVLSVIASWAQWDTTTAQILREMAATVLPDYLLTTLALCLLVALGVVLVGAAYLAVGLLMSALTSSQFIALVLTALVMLVLFIVGIGEFVAAPGTVVHAVCRHVSMWSQMASFSSGLIDTRHLVFDVSVVATCLFVTVRIVESWRLEGRA